jgi:hypothetical protein
MSTWSKSKGIQVAIAFSVALIVALSVGAHIAMDSFNHFYFAPHKAYPYPYPTARAAQIAFWSRCSLSFVGVFLILYLYLAQRAFLLRQRSSHSI